MHTNNITEIRMERLQSVNILAVEVCMEGYLILVGER